MNNITFKKDLLGVQDDLGGFYQFHFLFLA